MINNEPKEIEISTEMSIRYFNPIILMEEYSRAVADPSFTIRKTSQQSCARPLEFEVWVSLASMPDARVLGLKKTSSTSRDPRENSAGSGGDDRWKLRFTASTWRPPFEKFINLQLDYLIIPSNLLMKIALVSHFDANFRKWLIEGGTREIEITTDGMIHELNPASFMEEFSNAVENPSLSVISTLHHAQVECMDHHYRSRYIHTPHSWKPPFEKFVTLRLDYLIIPVDLIMKIIMLRFNKNVAGDWRVRATGKIDVKMIRGGLQQNMMCDRNHGGASFTVRFRKRDVITIEHLESHNIFGEASFSLAITFH
ncbi:hypothetical protein PRIPAC_83947 [Pristionchus pacificus]|uniref:Uncharacterized protein n=1 Tax=Pristionchus pacificus TaxID=54126 RepID=A0A2A6BSF4_PRIPA|nr:hypothetical protein PRIPAC_83947 [Pristionchus pacificus]|eukprot:PDM68818.1 hypothetical protein PRIPAC_47120 [Pristionchus pacificus]